MSPEVADSVAVDEIIVSPAYHDQLMKRKVENISLRIATQRSRQKRPIESHRVYGAVTFISLSIDFATVTHRINYQYTDRHVSCLVT